MSKKKEALVNALRTARIKAEAAEKAAADAELEARILAFTFNEATDHAKFDYEKTMKEHKAKGPDWFRFESKVQKLLNERSGSSREHPIRSTPSRVLLYKDSKGNDLGCDASLWEGIGDDNWRSCSNWYKFYPIGTEEEEKEEIWLNDWGKTEAELAADRAARELMPIHLPITMAEDIAGRLGTEEGMFIVTVEVGLTKDSCVDEDPDLDSYPVGVLYRPVTGTEEFDKPVWIPDTTHEWHDQVYTDITQKTSTRTR